MTRWLYSLIMCLCQPLLRRKLAHRGVQEPGYLVALPERFGYYSDAPALADGPLIWVHAVSLGETRAAAVLVARLREQVPGMRLLLTHGTATGRTQGAELLGRGDVQVWQPWDTPAAVRRFLDHFKPRIGLLMETEVWPNLAAHCQRRGIALALVNARLNERSLRLSLRLAWLARPAYAGLVAVWAQTAADAARLTTLGARVQAVVGNLKFDATPDAQQLTRGGRWRAHAECPVAMLASSREGEEQALLQLLRSSPAPQPIQWLIVPRHPQRFAEVAALIEAHGFVVSRRSAWPDGPPAAEGGAASTVWLGDSLGEMALYYALAEVALLGGSFEPLGGQNLIEAAACACPVLMGPHTFNFADAAELAAAAGAARRVSSLRHAVHEAQMLAIDSAARARMAEAAAQFSNAHRGALEKTLAGVLALLRQQGIDTL